MPHPRDGGNSATLEYSGMNAETAYHELLHVSRDKARLASCAELLGWDEVTYMPPAGAAHGPNNSHYLAGLIHDRSSDPRLGDLLATVESSDLVADSDSIPAANVRELRRPTTGIPSCRGTWSRRRLG